jgi:hypothetical protein
MKFKIKDNNSSGYFSLKIKGTEADVDVEWLNAEADFQLNGFTARFDFSLRLGELISFYEELHVFHTTLKGSAHLESIEDNVNLVLTTDGLGHVSIEGILRDTSYKINTKFSMDTDQTYLNDIINDCREILDTLGVDSK